MSGIDRDRLLAVLHGWSPPAMLPFNDALADAILALVRPVEGPSAREIADWFEREAEPGDPTDWRLRTAQTIRHEWDLT